MIDLSQRSGLPITMDDKTFHLHFGDGVVKVEPSVRKFADMKNVLMDPTIKSERDDLYYMYRDVHRQDDEQIIRTNKVRYDITVLPPSMLGSEFVKTAGHYHSQVPGEEYEYPEIYEVLYGNALFMIQKIDKEGKAVTVMVIQAGVGDKIVYPPNYGHIIINFGTTVLVTANWVSSEYSADYQSIVDKHGMAYYVIKDGASYKLVPNKAYGEVPPAKIAQGHMDIKLGFSMLEPMYTIGIKHPDRLDFLNNPHKYAVELSSITS